MPSPAQLLFNRCLEYKKFNNHFFDLHNIVLRSVNNYKISTVLLITSMKRFIRFNANI